MFKKPKANQVVNGSFGKVWFNGMKMANVKSFESKLVASYEDLAFAEDLGTHRKLIGYDGEGTMVVHKVDSYVAKLALEAIQRGEQPDIMIVGGVDDPGAIGAERIQYNEVTLDEIVLTKFEQKTVSEEEIPFKFASATPLQLMD